MHTDNRSRTGATNTIIIFNTTEHTIAEKETTKYNNKCATYASIR